MALPQAEILYTVAEYLTFQVGRIRARYLTVRLPNPPVRTGYAVG